MNDEYPYHQNDAFSKLLRGGFKHNHLHVLIEKDRSISSEQCLIQIKKYMNWLDTLNVQSVMLLSEPSINSICLMYAVVISNRTYLSVHTSMSGNSIKAQMDRTCFDLLLVDPNLKVKFQRDFDETVTKKVEEDFFSYKNQNEKLFSILPGMMFFTSGTLSQPKLCHYHYRVIADYLSFCLVEFKPTVRDVFLFSTKLSVIACLRPLFLPMFVGGSVVISDHQESNKIEHLLALINQHRITILTFLPTFFKVFQTHVVYLRLGIQVISVRQIFLGGEAIRAHDINQWFTFINAQCEFYNLYGATEYFMPFYKKINKKLSESEADCLGTLRKGSDYALVLKEDDVYYLYVSGSLCTGYLDLTLSLSHFAIQKDKRFFKTDDIVTIKGNNIYFYACNSRMIKRLGQKINLEHIEKVYFNFDPMGKAAAIVDGDNQIHFIIEGENNAENIYDLKKCFSKHLPDYMLPEKYEFKHNIALTPSGKINYGLIHNDTLNFFKKFFTSNEVDDSYMLSQLGLTSIDYIELSDYVRKRTGKYFDVSQNQANIKLSEISTYLQSLPTFLNKDDKKVKLNHIQVHMYVKPFLKIRRNLGRYVCRYALVNEISLYKLKKSIVATVNNHFMLSCRILKKDDDYSFERVKTNKTIINKKVAFSAFQALTDEQLTTSVNDSQLVKIYLEKINNKKYLIISFHHIALDAWSIINLREEILLRYENNFVNKMPSLEVQVKHLNMITRINQTKVKDISRLLSTFDKQSSVNPKALLAFFDGADKLISSTFTLGKSAIDDYMEKHQLVNVPYSTIFLMIMYESIVTITQVEKFVTNITLSNRLSSSLYTASLMLSAETMLPLVMLPHKTKRQLAVYVTERLTLYFHHMNYDVMSQFYTNDLIKSWLNVQTDKRYKINYTYVSSLKGHKTCQHRFIDWQQSSSELLDAHRGQLFFQVYELGDKFVVHFDSKMIEGMHLKLSDLFHSLVV